MISYFAVDHIKIYPRHINSCCDYDVAIISSYGSITKEVAMVIKDSTIRLYIAIVPSYQKVDM